MDTKIEQYQIINNLVNDSDEYINMPFIDEDGERKDIFRRKSTKNIHKALKYRIDYRVIKSCCYARNARNVISDTKGCLKIFEGILDYCLLSKSKNDIAILVTEPKIAKLINKIKSNRDIDIVIMFIDNDFFGNDLFNRFKRELDCDVEKIYI